MATTHGKKEAFGPDLGLRPGNGTIVLSAFDTDALATFTGGVPRPKPI